MKPLTGAFTREERVIFQATYCGLCRWIRYEYGILGIVGLNYEVTTMLLLAAAMADKDPCYKINSCSLTPFIWRRMCGIREEAYSLAAGLSIIIASLEVKDNVIDNGSIVSRICDSLLKLKVNTAKKMHYESIKKILDSYEFFMQIEQRAIKRPKPDDLESLTESCGSIVGTCARLIGELVCGCDYFQLESFMKLWGKWLYLLDAADDFEEDEKNGRYNPLLFNKGVDINQMLQNIEMQIEVAYRKMPVKRYTALLNSLLFRQLPQRRKSICELL